MAGEEKKPEIKKPAAPVQLTEQEADSKIGDLLAADAKITDAAKKMPANDRAALEVIRAELPAMYEAKGSIQISKEGKIIFDEKADEYLKTLGKATDDAGKAKYKNVRNAYNTVKEGSLIGDNMWEAGGAIVGAFTIGSLLESFLPSWLAKPIGAILGAIIGTLTKVFAFGDTSGWLAKQFNFNKVDGPATPERAMEKALHSEPKIDEKAKTVTLEAFPESTAADATKLVKLGTANLQGQSGEPKNGKYTVVARFGADNATVTDYILYDESTKKQYVYKTDDMDGKKLASPLKDGKLVLSSDDFKTLTDDISGKKFSALIASHKPESAAAPKDVTSVKDVPKLPGVNPDVLNIRTNHNQYTPPASGMHGKASINIETPAK